METTQTLADPPTPEAIWAILRETARRQEETDRRMQETDRQMKENAKQQKETDRLIQENAKRQKETDRLVKETDQQMKDTARLVKETNRQIGKLGGRFGEMIEYMVMPNLMDKFLELGLVFTKGYHQSAIEDKQHNIIAEVDITLENGDKVMIVEVKSKPSAEDIKDHIERMEKVRLHGDLHGDKRKYLGAVAGMVFNAKERDFALKNGFYGIEPSGDTFTITPPKGQPKEW